MDSDTPVSVAVTFLVLAKHFAKIIGGSVEVLKDYHRFLSLDISTSLDCPLKEDTVPKVVLYKTDKSYYLIVMTPSLHMQVDAEFLRYASGDVTVIAHTTLDEIQLSDMKIAKLFGSLGDAETYTRISCHHAHTYCHDFAHYTDLVKRTFPGVKK